MESNGQVLERKPLAGVRWETHSGQQVDVTNIGTVLPVTKKIAIVAKAPSTRDQAPYDDSSWEIWGLGDQAMPGYPHPIKRWDRWFEIHDLDDGFRRWLPQYKEWICSNHGKTLYINATHPDVPHATVYPRREIFAHFDKFLCDQDDKPLHYYTNSVAWMLALAIYEGATEIALYGVDMAQHGIGLKSEYAYQRPSVELWLGIAAGKGIKVTIPKESDLLKTPHLYGFDSETNAMRLKYKPRVNDINNGKKKASENSTKAQFEIRRMQYHLRHWKAMLQGVTGSDEAANKLRDDYLEKCAQFHAAIRNQRDAMRAAQDRQYVLAGADEDMQYWHQHIFG